MKIFKTYSKANRKKYIIITLPSALEEKQENYQHPATFNLVRWKIVDPGKWAL